MHTVLLGPEVHRLARELGPVIDGDRLWSASQDDDLAQRRGHLLAAEGVVSEQRPALACDRRPSAHGSSVRPEAVAQRNPCSTSGWDALRGPRARSAAAPGLSASGYAQSVPLYGATACFGFKLTPRVFEAWSGVRLFVRPQDPKGRLRYFQLSPQN